MLDLIFADLKGYNDNNNNNNCLDGVDRLIKLYNFSHFEMRTPILASVDIISVDTYCVFRIGFD